MVEKGGDMMHKDPTQATALWHIQLQERPFGVLSQRMGFPRKGKSTVRDPKAIEQADRLLRAFRDLPEVEVS